MIDWHCHILPGLDDGPECAEESVAMARILAEAGFAEIYCTPHRIPGTFETTSGCVRREVAALQALIDREGVRLKLHPGTEYYLDENFTLNDLQTLGDTRFLLVEFPTRASAAIVLEHLQRVLERGLTPVIAHPERSDLLSFQRRTGGTENFRGLFGPSSSAPSISLLRRMGCLFQGNVGSFAGRYGEEVRRRARHLLCEGAYSHFGSDAHRAVELPRTLAAGLAEMREIHGSAAGSRNPDAPGSEAEEEFLAQGVSP